MKYSSVNFYPLSILLIPTHSLYVGATLIFSSMKTVGYPKV